MIQSEGTVKVSCPSCHKGLKVQRKMLGKRGKCPKCGHLMTLAAIDPAAAESTPPSEVKTEGRSFGSVFAGIASRPARAIRASLRGSRRGRRRRRGSSAVSLLGSLALLLGMAAFPVAIISTFKSLGTLLAGLGIALGICGLLAALTCRRSPRAPIVGLVVCLTATLAAGLMARGVSGWFGPEAPIREVAQAALDKIKKKASLSGVPQPVPPPEAPEMPAAVEPIQTATANQPDARNPSLRLPKQEEVAEQMQSASKAVEPARIHVPAPAKLREPASSSPQRMPSVEAKSTVADPRTAKLKLQKKDDLHDFFLEIPEDARPELKVILKTNALALRSKRFSERLKAAQALGELGQSGKPVRALLCRTLCIDPVPGVRVAAADSLKNIDPKMHHLAVSLLTEKNTLRLAALLAEIQKLEDEGEPLAYLVANFALTKCKAGQVDVLLPALTTLSFIAKNDLAACKLIASALSNADARVRERAMQVIVGMKHRKLAVPAILSLLKTDTLVAIETLTILADESTEEVIAAAIRGYRYHDREVVRKAVETALNQLENKRNP